MKIILIVVVLVVAIGSFVADYKWKQWVARQRAARQGDANHGNPDRDRF